MEPEFEERIRQFPEALAPVYLAAWDDQSVTLAAGEMVLRQADLETSPAPGRVSWRWRPLPGMAFAIDDAGGVWCGSPNAYVDTAVPALTDGRPPKFIFLGSAMSENLRRAYAAKSVSHDDYGRSHDKCIIFNDLHWSRRSGLNR